MTVDWTHELLDQLDWHWHHQVTPRLEGLSDEEYFWEPVPGCWSIRPRGDGTFSYDYTHPEPSPAPFTTIAAIATTSPVAWSHRAGTPG